MAKIMQPLQTRGQDIYYEQRRLSVNEFPMPLVPATTRIGSSRRAAQYTLFELLQSLVQTLMFFLIFSSLIGRFEIRQSSMEPSFHEGQRVMVSQVGSFWLHHFTHQVEAAGGHDQQVLGLQRGQVVVFFDNPEQEGDALIKRLIALPGDTIEIRDGNIWINGARQMEPYVHGAFTECSTYCGPLTLGPNEYFFMGDNRSVSRDSRTFGTIPADQIVGRVIIRFWPLEEFALYL